jgi:signal peptidase I
MPGEEEVTTAPKRAALDLLERARRRWRSRRVVVRDRSMEPTFRAGERLFVDPLAYRDDPPARGDLVIIADPADAARRLLKRVVGVPGDFVRVTLEGVERRDDPAPPGTAPPGSLEELEVPPDHVFVLSDRPTRTRDSRQFGPIPRRTVLARVWYRYYPPSRAGEIDAGE